MELSYGGISLIVTIALFLLFLFMIWACMDSQYACRRSTLGKEKKCKLPISIIILIVYFIICIIGFFFLRNYVSKQDDTFYLKQTKEITDFKVSRRLNYNYTNNGDVTKHFTVNYELYTMPRSCNLTPDKFEIGDENKIVVEYYENDWRKQDYWQLKSVMVTPEVAEFLNFDLTAPVEIKDGSAYGESYYQGEVILNNGEIETIK